MSSSPHQKFLVNKLTPFKKKMDFFKKKILTHLVILSYKQLTIPFNFIGQTRRAVVLCAQSHSRNQQLTLSF